MQLASLTGNRANMHQHPLSFSTSLFKRGEFTTNINTPRTLNNNKQNGESPQSGQNTALSSARVVQLKREIEELDARLIRTNTINFEDVRSQNIQKQYNEISAARNIQESYASENSLEGTVKSAVFDIEDKDILKQSRGPLSTTNRFAGSAQFQKEKYRQHLGVFNAENRYSQPPNEDVNSSIHIYQQISNNAAQISTDSKIRPHSSISLVQQMPFYSTSHFTQEAAGPVEVSFDIEKITQSRNLNLNKALTSNFQAQKERISELEYQVFQLKKEDEAKSLKLNHLKFERDNIIHKVQIESLKKHEKAKEAHEQLKRIEVKKREEEKAHDIAQIEIKRQINEQETKLSNILSQIEIIELSIKQLKQRGGVVANQMHQVSGKPISNELNERINQLQNKMTSLSLKKVEVDNNVRILKDFLKSICEEIQMTQEDLSGKLMQRAEFVAQREELDQMYDSGRMAFGKSFELYLKINDINGVPSGSQSSRFFNKEYETEKAISFFSTILQQLKQQCKTKYHDMIDQVMQKIENTSLTQLEVDKSISWICQTASQVNIQLEKKVLQRRLELSMKEKDELFAQRQQQLREIILEIKRFEKLIKENSNMVDNMILPQLKAMSATYQEHKEKYKKLRQAGQIIRQQLRKAEAEFKQLSDKRAFLEAQYSETGHLLQDYEEQMKSLNEQMKTEQDEMDRLHENASQIEKEFRRAHQTLLLKEREIQQQLKFQTSETSVSQSLNATQLSLLSNQRQQEQEDERLMKRYKEIQENIRAVQQEKEDIEASLIAKEKELKETKDTCDHAEKVVMNSQRAMVNQNKGFGKRGVKSSLDFNQDIQNEGYQITSFTENDNVDMNIQQPFGISKANGSNSRQQNHKPSYSTASLGVHNNIGLKQDNKENNIQGHGHRNAKESLTRLDLSKVQALKESSNLPTTYSGMRSSNNHFEPINYDKHTSSKQDLDFMPNLQQESTTLADLTNSTQLQPGVFKQSQYQHHYGVQDQTCNPLQQSKFVNESQANSSLMNLSDLIVHNNPALQNILHMAAVNEHPNTNPQTMQQFRGQGLHVPNQQNTVDNSLISYLDDMNFNTTGGCQQIQREVYQGYQDSIQNGENHAYQIDLSQRKKLDSRSIYKTQNSPTTIKMRLYNGQSQGNSGQSINFGLSKSSINSVIPKEQVRSSTAKNLGLMTKYLNTGQGCSRMDGQNFQNDISPVPEYKGGNFISKGWNRSSSQDKTSFIGPNHLNVNASMNSIPYMGGHYNSIQTQSYMLPETQNYSRSGSRIKQKTRKLNKSLNGLDSSSLLQQSITTSSLLNPVTMSMKFGNNINYLRQSQYNSQSYLSGQDNIQFSKVDVSFAERIVPLLDGAAFYKKFSSRQSLNEKAFDPLNADKIPPENCGYGIRLFQLDKSLVCINVRMSLKIAVETTISLNDIVKPILPQTTMDIIREQKHFVQNSHNHSTSNGGKIGSRNGQPASINGNLSNLQHLSGLASGGNSTKDLLEEFLILESKGSISHLAKIGIVNKNSELYRQKCLDSTFYPFSIALTNGRVELIATSYETLKNWIIGINLLVNNKKHIPKLKQLMELKLD